MPTPTKFGFGASMRRKEDDAFVRGAGCYVADVAPTGALAAIVLRSPHAHARFRITDAAAARAMPGVRLVLVADDVADLGPLPCQIELPGTRIAQPPYPILAQDVVRHVGDAIAFVAADTVEQAKDAAEAIAVEWEALPHVTDAVAALKSGAPPVWPDIAGNLACETTLGDETKTRKAFASAAKTVALTVVNQRLAANYLDTRAVIGESDGKRITLTLGSQGSHAIRDILCNDVLKIPPQQMRAITPDVGGGFGTKLFPYREYALAAVAAQRLRQPVKWVAERNEHFLGDAQGRDNITTVKLALDDKGRFLALDVDLIANMGAYLSCYAPFIPFIGAGMSPGVYDIPACFVRIRSVFTNTVPVDAYRGAGRPEAAYVLERLVDVAARELDIAPDILRKRNFIKPKVMPHTTQTGKVYDSGEFAGHMQRAQEIGGWATFRKRHAQSRKAGKLRGIGLATYIEACGGNGPENALVRLETDGTLTVLIGSQSTGQGHHTAYAQIIAEQLDVPPAQVRVVQGDTDAIRSGLGTGGSSSIPCGGASLAGATAKLADNLKSLAADALEAGVGDLEIAGGQVRVAGTDRAISFADLAASPKASAEKLHGRGCVRAARDDLSQRDASRRGRDRRRHRPGRHRQLRRGRRLRRDAQSADAGRPSARRRRAGHRAGADGARGVRSLGPARHRDPDGLRAAARERRAGVHLRDPQRALHHQPAWREGRGRGRCHRLMPGADERHPRRALARLPGPPHRHAGNPGAAVAGDRRGAAGPHVVSLRSEWRNAEGANSRNRDPAPRPSHRHL